MTFVPQYTIPNDVSSGSLTEILQTFPPLCFRKKLYRNFFFRSHHFCLLNFFLFYLRHQFIDFSHLSILFLYLQFHLLMIGVLVFLTGNRYDNVCKCHFKGRHLTDHESLLLKENKEVKIKQSTNYLLKKGDSQAWEIITG